jgi:hypothetical protein
MIVFGVCAAGVGSLYLVPGIARSPEQIRHSGANVDPPNSAIGVRPAKPQESASSTGDRTSIPGDDGEPAKTAAGARPSQPMATPTDSSEDADGRSSRKARTPQSKSSKDSEPPQPVTDIEPSKITPQQLTVSWPAASDNVGVIGYRIWLNGFEVATTAETNARVRWFNDDSGQYVVQIRAIDAAGNQSRSSPTLVVTRPTPEPTDTPMPEPSDSPRPSEQSEPSHPGAQSSESSSRTPTDEKSSAEDEHR